LFKKLNSTATIEQGIIIQRLFEFEARKQYLRLNLLVGSEIRSMKYTRSRFSILTSHIYVQYFHKYTHATPLSIYIPRLPSFYPSSMSRRSNSTPQVAVGATLATVAVATVAAVVATGALTLAVIAPIVATSAEYAGFVAYAALNNNGLLAALPRIWV
jgi:hypothetical protein